MRPAVLAVTPRKPRPRADAAGAFGLLWLPRRPRRSQSHVVRARQFWPPPPASLAREQTPPAPLGCCGCHAGPAEVKVRSIGTSEVDIEIDDVVCRKVKVIVVNDSALPVDMLVGRTWTEQDHIAYLRMGDELRIGYRDDLPFCDIDLAQMKPSKEPLRVKETMCKGLKQDARQRARAGCWAPERFCAGSRRKDPSLREARDPTATRAPACSGLGLPAKRCCALVRGRTCGRHCGSSGSDDKSIVLDVRIVVRPVLIPGGSERNSEPLQTGKRAS
ncbi:hypothetical protein HPB47_014087 [Ixodes persulcatus]|uniref:Uncharacterized protein n=1 Tax=Ixodes persulcatus TaxID=34615 RepID=A0AC60QWS3_IXOPE|nr:hypothetical protein HPB47_014087 [Ixodes persulcatus]